MSESKSIENSNQLLPPVLKDRIPKTTYINKKGEERYWDGKRLVNKVKAKERGKKWRENNKEKIKKYCKDNKEKNKKKSLAWYEKNKERQRKKSRDWQKKQS